MGTEAVIPLEIFSRTLLYIQCSGEPLGKSDGDRLVQEINQLICQQHNDNISEKNILRDDITDTISNQRFKKYGNFHLRKF